VGGAVGSDKTDNNSSSTRETHTAAQLDTPASAGHPAAPAAAPSTAGHSPCVTLGQTLSAVPSRQQRTVCDGQSRNPLLHIHSCGDAAAPVQARNCAAHAVNIPPAAVTVPGFRVTLNPETLSPALSCRFSLYPLLLPAAAWCVSAGLHRQTHLEHLRLGSFPGASAAVRLNPRQGASRGEDTGSSCSGAGLGGAVLFITSFCVESVSGVLVGRV
jgi:hypothetical protein